MSELSDNIAIKLNRFGNDVINKMIKKLESGGPGRSKGSSNFIKALESRRTIDTNAPVVSVEEDRGELELLLTIDPYGYWIDKGRGAGKMPPDGALDDWMRRHNIPTKKEFPIRKKIGKEGVKPVPFLNIWTQMISIVNEILEEASKESIEIELDELIKKINK